MDDSIWHEVPVGSTIPPREAIDLVKRIDEAADAAGLGWALHWVNTTGGVFARDQRVLAAYEDGFVFARKDVSVFAWSDIEVFRMIDVPDAKRTYRFTGWVEITAAGRKVTLKPMAGDLPLPEDELLPVSMALLSEYHTYLDETAAEALRTTGRFSFGAAEISADGVRAGDTLVPWRLVGPTMLIHGHLRIHDTSGSGTPVLTVSGSTVTSATVLGQLVDRLAAEYRQHGRLTSVPGAPTSPGTVTEDPSFTRPVGEDALLAVVDAAAAAHGLHDPRRWCLVEQTGAARLLPRSGVVIYANGYVLVAGKKKAYAATWPKITELAWTHRERPYPRSTLEKFRVTAGKASFSLNSDGTGSVPLRDFGRIANPLEEAYVRYLRERDAAGGPVRYGKWELTAEGLSAKRRTIPWSAVTRAEFDGEQVTLFTENGKKTKLTGFDVGCPSAFAVALQARKVPITQVRLLM